MRRFKQLCVRVDARLGDNCDVESEGICVTTACGGSSSAQE